jgi:hypothetical protein
MNKRELIKALEPFDDDNVVVIGDFTDEYGWSNIGKVKSNGSTLSIIEAAEPWNVRYEQHLIPDPNHIKKKVGKSYF